MCETRSSSVRVFAARPGGGFEAPRDARLGIPPWSLVLADLDGDGLLDITASSMAAKEVSVAMNRGAGGFAPAVEREIGFAAMDHRLADFNGDGALDLAALSTGGSAALVLLGRPAPPPGPFRRGDVDGNGQLQVTDPVALIGRLFLGDGPLACDDAADADDDGRLNITDVVVLLGRIALGGDPLPPPGPGSCGEDPTVDPLRRCEQRC